MNTKILAEVFSETDLTYIQQLDERQRRLYCATRAIYIGKHGVAAVCASIHISKNTIYRGIRELNGKTNLSSGTVRIAGGGRKAILDEHPEYLVLFDEIVQKHMAGLPQDDSVNIFKQELLKLATSLELDIIIAHYPPYCSKYNPIEHKLFAHITRSWSGVPLLSAEYACKKANETTTSKGLVVVASINSKEYQTQRTLDESYVSERQKRIRFDKQLPKWNYVVRCKSA